MNTNKYLFLLIILFAALPCKSVLAQEVDETDTVQSELDVRYDSLLGKATLALTASDYQRAIDYYKEAGTIKENDTYAYKMIKYVEELAAKQKRADELERKAQIKDGLIRANQAVADKKWDSAKTYFSQVLALHPDKADEDFARAKVSAIDLELQRIVVSTPVKEAPKPVYVPKTGRQIREQRQLKKRNAIMAAGARRAMEQQQLQPKASSAPAAQQTQPIASSAPAAQQTQPKVSTTGNSTAGKGGASINYELLRHFNEDFRRATNINWNINTDFAKVDFLLDDEKVEAFYDLNGMLVGTSRYVSVDQVPKEARRIFATRYPQYAISEVIRYEGIEDVAYYISTSDNREKVVFKLLGSRDITVFSRTMLDQNIVSGTNVPKTSPQKTVQTSVPQAPANTGTTPVQAQPSPTQAPPAANQAIPNPAQAQPNRSQAPPVAGNQGIVAPAQTQPNRTQAPPVAGNQNVATPAQAQPNRTQTSAANNSNTAGRVSNGIARPIDTVAKSTGSAVQAPRQALPSGQPLATNNRAATTSGNTNPAALPPANNSVRPKPAETTTPARSEPVSLPSPGLTATTPTETAPTETSGLKLSDSSNYVKVICQDISFIGSNAYIKVLIQNDNPTDSFQTDTLHVSVVKNNGAVKRLNQRFVSNFPVVRPMQELVLVSLSDASAGVDPSDIFIIEMRDKAKNTKFSIQVPWRVYSQTKNL